MGGGSSRRAKQDVKTSTSGLATEEEKPLQMPFAYSKGHVQTILAALKVFQSEEKFCDVKLLVRDKYTDQTRTYLSHKCVLAASSGYCKELLDRQLDAAELGDEQLVPESVTSGSFKSLKTIQSETTEITMEFSLAHKAMDQVMVFLYTAEIETSNRDILDLLEAAARLQMPSLKRYCIWGLRSGYALDFFTPILRLSEELDLPALKEYALRRTIQKFDAFVDTRAFLQLTEKEMQTIVNNRRGCVSDGIVIPEVEMFNGILKWEKFDHNEREGSARRLLRHLHYREIPKNTLSGYIATHDLVKGDEKLRAVIEGIVGPNKNIFQRLRKKTNPERFEEGEGDASVETCSNTTVDRITLPSQPSSLLLCGGRLYDQVSAQVLLLDEKQSSWSEISRMPIALSYHGVAQIENSLFIAGGEDTTIAGSYSAAGVWRYVPWPKNEWTPLPDLQLGRSYFFLAAFNDSLYAFGGKSGKIIRNSTERYTLNSKKWEFAASMKMSRYAHAGCVHKNMMYVNGGVVKKHSSVDMLRLDPIANHWTTMSPMRCARSKHGMAPVRDRIYVIGGDNDPLGASQSSVIAIECYTPDCDQWHNVAVKMPVLSDGEFGYAELGGEIYIVGGCKSKLAEHRAEVFSYEPEGDRWQSKARLPRRLRGSVCVVLNAAC